MNKNVILFSSFKFSRIDLYTGDGAEGTLEGAQPLTSKISGGRAPPVLSWVYNCRPIYNVWEPNL